MELGLKGKIALVTGRDAKALDEVAAAIRAKGRRAGIATLDLREKDAPAKLIEQVKRELDGLDILINNAGATKRGDFLGLTDADWEDGYALKFFGHMRLVRAAWPLLKERRGSLITIGGTGARKPTAEFTIGSSVNAAVAAFTKCLADRGKEDGVQVNCIHPSMVETDRLWKRIAAEMERTGWPEKKAREEMCRGFGITRFGTVEDVADLISFLASARATWMHGATIDLDGGEIMVL
jgi:3-oxoacyl-[acyl-carrier protein] reductase